MPRALPALALALPFPALADGDPFEALAPVLVTAAVFSAIVAVVGIVTYAGHRARVMRHEVIRLALEKGQPLPPELLRDPERRLDATRDLRRGLTLLALGLGTALFFLYIPGDEGGDAPWSIGFVPALLGLGYLATWLMTGRPRAAAGEDGGAPAPGRG